ncbi:MAG: hypothetical protein WC444_05710 [Candidatus Paceibacterota bacterium]
MASIDMSNTDFLEKLVILRKTNPTEYKEFMDGMKAVMIDMMAIAKDVSESM